MARRKSLNRRSNRYSRGSIGGILNPDTNIIDDEDDLWWANLENDTLVPQSRLTSAVLTSDSHVSSTETTGEWWKALPRDSSSFESRSVQKGRTAESSKFVIQSTTSESEETTPVKKRKLPLRAANRKSSVNNVFLQVLQDSKNVNTSAVEKEVNDTASKTSHARKDTSDTNENDRSNGSIEYTSKIDAVARSKPNVFKKRQHLERSVNSSSNRFDDLLEEKQIQRSSSNERNDIPSDALGDRVISDDCPVVKLQRLDDTVHKNFSVRKSSTSKIRSQSEDDSDSDDVAKSAEIPNETRNKALLSRRFDRSNNTSEAVLEENTDSRRRGKKISSADHSKVLNEDSDSVANIIDKPSHTPKDISRGDTSEQRRSSRKRTKKHHNLSVSELLADNVRNGSIRRSSRTPGSVSRASSSRLTRSTSRKFRDESIEEEDVSNGSTFKEPSPELTGTPRKRGVPVRAGSSRLSRNRSTDFEPTAELERSDDTPPNSSIGRSARSSKANLSGVASETVQIDTAKDTNGIVSSRQNNSRKGSLVQSAANSSKSTADAREDANDMSRSSRPDRKVATGPAAAAVDLEKSVNKDIERLRSSYVALEDISFSVSDTSRNKSAEGTEAEKSRTSPVSASARRSRTRTRIGQADTSENGQGAENAASPSSRGGDAIRQSSRSAREETNGRKSEGSRKDASTAVNKQHVERVEPEETSIPTARMNIRDFFERKGPSADATTRPDTTERHRSEFHEKLLAVKAELAEKNKSATTEKRPDKRMGAAKKLPAGKSKASNATLKPRQTKPAKEVHPAYLVNGKVYKQPRLPRPKHWVTNRLYRHLWKCMEPKYKLETRVRSEKFVLQLSRVISVITRRKKYDNYKEELHCLMMEMARLGIVRTREDFYHFCYEFLPYEFRAKVTPMVLPGNVRNIPFDPSTLHAPLLDEQ